METWQAPVFSRLGSTRPNDACGFFSKPVALIEWGGSVNPKKLTSNEGHTARSRSISMNPPLPPFTAETAAEKARLAEDAWNTRDPARVALAYTSDSRWR